jgi:Flp pilus assembly protein TadD
MRQHVAAGPVFIPPIDNAMSLVPAFPRVLTALWVQVLYVQKSLLPVTLSADYSYKEIPLVMGLHDGRAWGALLLVAGAVWVFLRRPAARLGLLLWSIPFLPTANLLFPIGTAMGERLAYLPSLGLAVLVAPLALKPPKARFVLAAIALAFAARTAVRNLDWRDADAFYPTLALTSPGSAKVHYFLGCWRAARGDDTGALSAYDHAVAIFPAYPEAYNNRAGTLLRLGRVTEAKESYRQCLRFDPGHSGAATSLTALEAGIPFTAKRPRV